MASTQVLTQYVKKLSHPLKEIRERSLQLLITKLQLGWELDDELSGTREMLEALLAWFHVQQPSLQKEALMLLSSTIKTKTGTYIAKEFGIKKILSTLIKVKNKINPDALEMYDDLMESLKFLNTVVSEENISDAVPPLSLQSLGSTESSGSSSGYYNLGTQVTTSKETSISNDGIEMNRNETKPPDGVRLLLFPWVEVCSSDSKTMLLIEDALKLLKSTRRCCKFIRDVFLRDFPADIFLNRPAVIKHLVSISEGDCGGHPGEALHVLLCITRALRIRLRQLTSLDLIHDNNKIKDDQKECNDRVNAELEQIAGYGLSDAPNNEDALVALRQLPAPLYALDTMHAVLTATARNIVLVEPGDKVGVVDLKDSNTCLSLIESLTELLLDCVADNFWCGEHSHKTHRDIAHKSCMVMRLLGDLLTKYRKSFLEESTRWHHRVAWLRLTACSVRLLHWSRHSALPPSSLAVALQAAQLDPAVDMFYPELSAKVADALQNSKIALNQEYKTKYRELKKLVDSMKKAAQFMRNKNTKHTKQILNSIKGSLPALGMHQNEEYLDQIIEILLWNTREFDMDDNDWSVARSVLLSLMAHNIDWVKTRLYSKLAEMVRTVLISDNDASQADSEKCLTLLCDVGVLTEICCHGLSSQLSEVESSASNIVVHLLRGRLVVSEGWWWRLLANLLPVLPLLHVYAAHGTHLGEAICKSLELDIATCMGISLPDVTAGLVRLLFVRCPSVQLDAAHALCQILDDERYLPPKEVLRADVLISALKRVEPQDFNIDHTASHSSSPQSTGLMQILDVLKQDLSLDQHGTDFTVRTHRPTLEPSLRRSTLQQLSVLMQQQELHDTFLQCDGLKIVIATLRMSMTVDDCLAYPECAISCVSILNSVCFLARHCLAKTPDLLAMLLRVILVFPANDSAVLMCAQLLAMVVWSGFVLQELDANRRRIPALPLSVTQRTSLPFPVNSYWNTSTNAEHSSLEWLVSDEDFRAAIRVHWWCACSGGARVLLGAPLPPAPRALRPSAQDLACLRAASPVYACTKLLMDLENATSHKQVNEALNMLEGYMHLLPLSSVHMREFGALPWKHTRRFLCAPPASSRDTLLLVTMLQFVISYLDNVTDGDAAGTWIKSSFLSDHASIISLLSRSVLYPQQTSQDCIEVTTLHIHIVKVLLRCIILWGDEDIDSSQMESLIKILLACLENVDLKNFHMLGYLNELVRTVRYAVNSSCCKLSEDTLLQCLQILSATLTGCACGGGRKGQACRLDVLLALLALIRQIQKEAIPVQRWSEVWSSEVVLAVVGCSSGARAELRAAGLRVMAALATHAQLLPHLTQAVPEESLSMYASAIFANTREANVVRTGAAMLLASITARHSPHNDALEIEMFQQLKNNDFLETAIEIFVDYCKENERKDYFEPNVPLSLLEHRTELEVRAKKCAVDVISPSLTNGCGRPPPTASLVAATADVIYNLSLLPNCPVQKWNERGLYRILFRCASWCCTSSSSLSRARASACRALSAVCAVKCARVTLANTKDCLYNLLLTMTPFHDDNEDPDSLSAREQAFQLLASLLSERAASDTVWRLLREQRLATFFVTQLQAIQSGNQKLQDAGLYCLTQLSQSANKKHSEKSKDSRIEFFDNLPSPYMEESSRVPDSARTDCQPAYMVEEYVKVLLELYKKHSIQANEPQNGDRWARIVGCLCSLLSVSYRSRLYGAHRQLPRTTLAILQCVRDRLMVHGPVDVIRNASNNPLIQTLQWLLTCISCHMVECQPAKEAFADDNLALSLNRLWPWCMLTDELRAAVIHLLVTFSNDCPKAWAAMSSCVGGRSLVAEMCALGSREASLHSRKRSDAPLLACLRTLRQIANHHHCRAIILKSDVLLNVYKLRVRDRCSSAAGVEWARLCEALARHGDGAGAVLALRPLPTAPAVRAQLMPAIAHVARHRRAAVLQAQDLLELLSGTLLAGDTAEVVSAARAVWALAANNHKAKLLLRSSGVAASVQSAVQRMQRLQGDAAAQRALQLLIYTKNVLQTT